MNRHQHRILPQLLLVAIISLAYLSSFGGVFLFDDGKIIEFNPRIRHILPATLAEWLSPRLFADISFAINFHFSGLNPVDYHLTNLLIHNVTALLLFIFLRDLTRHRYHPIDAGRCSEEQATWLSFIGTALWALHPLNTSCITYVVQRYEALMGMFALLCFVALHKSLRARHPGIWHLLVVLSYLLAIECKEVAIAIPALLLAFDSFLLSNNLRNAWQARGRLHLLLLLMSLLPLLMIMQGQSASAVQDSHYGGDPSLRYLLTQAGVIVHYLRLTLWPEPLCIDYAWPLVEGLGENWVEACALGGLFVLTLSGFRRYPTIAFSGLWFFAFLAPSSSFMPRPDCAFEHRMYVPLMALAGIAPVLLHRLLNILLRRPTNPRLLPELQAMVWIPILAGLGVMTAERNLDYHDAEGMWRQVTERRPANIRPYLSLTSAMLRDGRNNEAVATTQAALSRLPDFTGISYKDIQSIGQTNPFSPFVIHVHNYAGLHNNGGIALRRLDRLDAAIQHFLEACRIEPDYLDAHLNLGATYFQLGETARGIGILEQVCARDPQNPHSRQCLADMLYWQGSIPEAMDQYEMILRMTPDQVLAQCRLAWLLATTDVAGRHDAERARDMGLSLLRQTKGMSAHVYDILAAASARLGNVDDAIRYANEAISRTRGNERERIEARLKRYRQGLPFISNEAPNHPIGIWLPEN